jgi:hypothetical protein
VVVAETDRCADLLSEDDIVLLPSLPPSLSDFPALTTQIHQKRLALPYSLFHYNQFKSSISIKRPANIMTLMLSFLRRPTATAATRVVSRRATAAMSKNRGACAAMSTCRGAASPLSSSNNNNNRYDDDWSNHIRYFSTAAATVKKSSSAHDTTVLNVEQEQGVSNNAPNETTTTPSSLSRPTAPSNSTMPRTAFSIVGAVNAGKSVLMNLLTQSHTSIVHDTAGTTTDPKACLMELHGRIGPVRLLDTPGIDETGELGSFKKQKALESVGQCDVVLIVADPFAVPMTRTVQSVAELLRAVQQRQDMNRWAEQGSQQAQERIDASSNTKELKSVGLRDRPTPLPLLIFNLREDKVQELEDQPDGSLSMFLEDLEKKILQQWQATMEAEDDGSSSNTKKKSKKNLSLPPTLAVDFSKTQLSRDRVISFLESYADPRPASVSVLPEWLAVDEHATTGTSPTVFLNIPMDQQTPALRLLRPQAMIQEALIRNFVSTMAYRMDLTMARNTDDPEMVQREKDRFLQALDPNFVQWGFEIARDRFSSYGYCCTLDLG